MVEEAVEDASVNMMWCDMIPLESCLTQTFEAWCKSWIVARCVSTDDAFSGLDLDNLT